MTQEIEIEFKNILTKEQYDYLLKTFNIQDDMIVRQVNHYFDTDNFHLKALSSGLRIRETKERIVCTLKEKVANHTHLETTEEITPIQAEQIVTGKEFSAKLVEEKLKNHQVPIQQLKLIGSLTTDRAEISYKGGTLVFDHSFYLQCDDYEVEYESEDESIGKTIFYDLLAEHNIPIKSADKKIARFMNALNAKKG